MSQIGDELIGVLDLVFHASVSASFINNACAQSCVGLQDFDNTAEVGMNHCFRYRHSIAVLVSGLDPPHCHLEAVVGKRGVREKNERAWRKLGIEMSFIGLGLVTEYSQQARTPMACVIPSYSETIAE